MRPTTTRRPSPLRILRAHVQAKADAVVEAALSWAGAIGSGSEEDEVFALRRSCYDYREARALLAAASGQAEGPDHG